MERDKLSWKCVRCHEINEDEFDACWNCGFSKDGVEDPNFKSAVKVVFEPQCKKCGYSLFGLDRERCPECGTPFDRDLRDTRVLPGERSRFNPFVKLILYCLLIFVALVILTYVVAIVLFWREFPHGS